MAGVFGVFGVKRTASLWVLLILKYAGLAAALGVLLRLADRTGYGRYRWWMVAVFVGPLCINRQAILEAVVPEFGVLTDSFVSSVNPVYREIDDGLMYDPLAGAQLLEETGWRYMQDPPEGPRQSLGVPWLLGGTPLAFELLVPAGTIEEQVANIIVDNLADCGAEVTVQAAEISQLSTGWPDQWRFPTRI